MFHQVNSALLSFSDRMCYAEIPLRYASNFDGDRDTFICKQCYPFIILKFLLLNAYV